MTRFFTLFILLFIAFSTKAQTPTEKGLEAINQNMIRAQLEFLASDWTMGREAGTEGSYLAADYIASVFQMMGLQPAGDKPQSSHSYFNNKKAKNSYFQKFNIIKYKAADNQDFCLVLGDGTYRKQFDFNYKTDFTVTPGSVNQTIEAPLVFVGYGYKNNAHKYNDFNKIDVKGKIIVRLSGYPGEKDTASFAYKTLDEGLWWRLNRKKDTWAKEEGAVGIIELASDDRNLSPSNIPFRFEYRDFEADERFETFYSTRKVLSTDTLNSYIPTIKVSSRITDLIFEGEGINPDAFEKAVADKLIPNSKELKKRSTIKTHVETELIQVRNVLGKIEGKNPNEVIVVGGHYDHLGHYNGYIYNGADDNASGTVGVMSIAKAMLASGEQPEKTIIFAAWDAEESGLWGSRYFVANYPNMNELKHNLNFDMISRDSEKDSLHNKCQFIYSGDYKGFKDLTQKHIDDNNIDLDLSTKASYTKSGGSDYAPFAKSGISFHYFFAAMHEDYHQPQDETRKVNYKKMENIIKVGYLNIYHLANNSIDSLKYNSKDDE